MLCFPNEWNEWDVGRQDVKIVWDDATNEALNHFTRSQIRGARAKVLSNQIT